MGRIMFEHRHATALRPHQLSREIYGEEIDERFILSIRDVGILVPLVILRDGTIVSGRRRWLAAKKLKIDRIPCNVVEGNAADLDIQAAVIHSNRENERSTEQRGREFVELKRIEAEKAAIRMKAAPIRARAEKDKKSEESSTKDAPSKKTEHLLGPSGDARQIAAEAVGMSATTAEKVAAVVEKIDELEGRGHTRKAEELRETLETKSVAAAHREAVPPKPRQPRADRPIDRGVYYREVRTLVGKAIRIVETATKGTKHYGACRDSLEAFLKAWERWKENK